MPKFHERRHFFVVGAPKCGTTAMGAYLRAHPEIFMPEIKEIPCFGSDLNFKRPRLTFEQYLAYFSEVKDEKLVGEVWVWYLYSKRAAVEIKEFCPSARIIIMLRNPVDMLYAQHAQFLYNGNENITDFEAALNAEEDRKRGLRIPDRVILAEGLFYRETIKYTQQVQRYLDVFGREQVHIVIFDDLLSDIGKVYKETLCFLGVSPDFQPNFQVINPSKRVRSKTLRNFLYDPPPITRWLGKTLLPRQVRQKLWKSLTQYNTRYEPRPPMDLELRKRLQAELVPEVEQLSKLLGRDLRHWSC